MSDGSVTIDARFNNDELKKGLNKIGSIAKTGLKGVAIAVGTVTTAFAGIVTASINARGELEQQIGGIQTLFGTQGAKSIEEYANLVGKSVDEVKNEYETLSKAQEMALNNANNAYKTAGLSANEYMQTATSFAASLKQSTKDEIEAAKVADMAIVDMSDNANKMGTSMELIQNAYQGFAKQNYTMLDNLKLGYGGTKTEMERLLSDAEKISGIKYDINNLSDVYNAIHVIQGELGITGTTAKEASETLQGSFASMKASWQNLLSGSGDLGQVVDTATDVVKNLVRIASEAVPSIIENIVKFLPELLDLGGDIVNQLINGLLTYLPQLMQSAGQILSSLVQGILNYLPQILQVGIDIITQLLTGLTSNTDSIISTIFEVIQLIINTLINNLPKLLEMGMQLIVQLILGIAQKAPDIVPQIVDLIIKMLEVFNEHFNDLLLAGVQLIWGLIQGLIKSIPNIIKNLPTIIMAILNFLTAEKLVSAGVTLIKGLGNGLIKGIPNIIKSIPKLIGNIVNTFKTNGVSSFKDIGLNLVKGLWNGILDMKNWLFGKVKDFAKNIVGNIKDALGIHSPSTVFENEVGKFMALGIGEGFKNNLAKVYKQMKTAVDFQTQKLSANLSTTANVNRTLTANISIQGDTYLDSDKVGRIMTPKVSKNLRVGGVY